MGEDWLIGVLTSRWTAAASAYVLGLLTGWVIWGAEKTVVDNIDGDLNGDLNGDKPDPAALGALRDELKKAQSLLKAETQDQDGVNETVERLDETIKRANGRLKLILKSVKNKK